MNFFKHRQVSYTWRRRPKQAPEAAAASNARFSPKSDVKVSKVSRPAPAAPAAPAVRAAVAAVAAPAGFAAPKSGAGYTLAVKEGTSTGAGRGVTKDQRSMAGYPIVAQVGVVLGRNVEACHLLLIFM